MRGDLCRFTVLKPEQDTTRLDLDYECMESSGVGLKDYMGDRTGINGRITAAEYRLRVCSVSTLTQGIHRA